MDGAGHATIRNAQSTDSGGIWPLARDFATSFTPERSSFDTSFETLLHHADALLLVADVGDRIVGYLLAHTSLTLFANGPVAWVEELMVLPDARRTGVGRALMGNAEHWAKRTGAAYIALATRRASSFYRSLDYEESATFFKKALR